MQTVVLYCFIFVLVSIFIPEEDDAEDDTGMTELDQPLQFHLELDADADDNGDDMPELEVLDDDDDGDDVPETVD